MEENAVGVRFVVQLSLGKIINNYVYVSRP